MFLSKFHVIFVRMKGLFIIISVLWAISFLFKVRKETQILKDKKEVIEKNDDVSVFNSDISKTYVNTKDQMNIKNNETFNKYKNETKTKKEYKKDLKQINREEFSVRKAIIYSAILNKPYNW